MKGWRVAPAMAVALGGLIVAAPAQKTFDVYTLDVEGGKSVLAVSPSGESMLFDVGWPKAVNRDASTEVILDALKTAAETD